MNLFFKDERPLQQLLKGLSPNSAEFQFWAKTTLMTGWLEKMVDILVRTGKVEDKKEAVEYLERLGLQINSSDLKVARGDFTGDISRKPFRLLEQKLGYNIKTENIYPHYGIVSHQAIGDLISGKIPNYQKAAEILKQAPYARQSFIFKTKPARQSQPVLFSQAELLPHSAFVQEILPGNRISSRLEKEIGELWGKMTTMATKHSFSSWMDLYNLLRPLMPELEIRLFPVFQKHIIALKSDEAFSKYLKIITMMSWASLVSWFKNQLSPLFQEIPVLTREGEINGGRIDAIEVLSINGRQPDETEEELLKKMSSHSYSSVGHLVSALRRSFGHHLEFRITDWKFVMGKYIEEGRIIQPEELEKPLESHVMQVKGYATLANLDCYLHFADNKSPWHDHPYFTKVRLIYILPLSPPIVHEFEVTPRQQRKIFQKEFVDKLDLAKKQAVLRSFNNLLVGYVAGVLDGKEIQIKPSNHSHKRNSLFPEIEAKNRLKKIIEKNRAKTA